MGTWRMFITSPWFVLWMLISNASLYSGWSTWGVDSVSPALRAALLWEIESWMMCLEGPSDEIGSREPKLWITHPITDSWMWQQEPPWPYTTRVRKACSEHIQHCKLHRGLKYRDISSLRFKKSLIEDKKPPGAHSHFITAFPPVYAKGIWDVSTH